MPARREVLALQLGRLLRRKLRVAQELVDVVREAFLNSRKLRDLRIPVQPCPHVRVDDEAVPEFYNLGTEAIRTRDHRHELIVWNQDSRLGLDRRRLAIEAQRDRQGFPIPIEVAEACDDPRLAATGDLVSDVKKLLGEPELGIPVREQQRERARRGPLLPAPPGAMARIGQGDGGACVRSLARPGGAPRQSQTSPSRTRPSCWPRSSY